MPPTILLKKVVDATASGGASLPIDIKIKDGIITEIGNDLPSGDGHTVFALNGASVLPGFIDLHTHLRDFEQGDTEDIASGTKAAAAGGYVSVLAMANSLPPIDDVIRLQNLKARISSAARVEVIPVAAVTKGLKGLELTNMVELAENGAGAFSDDGKPITNLTVLRRALDYVKLTNAFIISHPEDADLSLHGVMNESASSTRLGLIGAPTAAEAAAIAREIEVVRYTKSRLHFAHVSAAASVSLIRRAKEDGLNVSADVTPHHLALTDNEIECYHGSYKMNPPLRTGEDQESLLEGLRDGTIDAIATDHAPHSNSTKNKTFDSCAFGVIGLETAFALMYDKLVKTNLFSLDHLIQLFSLRPAQILGRVAPKISKGATANLTVVDTRRSWRYDADQGFSKSSNSPFDGHTFTSKVILTIAQGKVSFEDLSK